MFGRAWLYAGEERAIGPTRTGLESAPLAPAIARAAAPAPASAPPAIRPRFSNARRLESPIVPRIDAAHATPNPMARLRRAPRPVYGRPGVRRAAQPDMHACLAERLRPARRTDHGLAGPGEPRRDAADADQPAGRSRPRDRGRQRDGQRDGHPLRAIARLFAGRRRELRAGAAVRTGRARAGARAPGDRRASGHVARRLRCRKPGRDQLDARADTPRHRRPGAVLPLAPRPAPARGRGHRELARPGAGRRLRGTLRRTRPGGADDPRPRGPRAVVRAAAHQRLGDQPPGPAVRGKAGAHVVAGRHLRARLRPRHRRDRRRHVHESGAGESGQRPAGGPPRLPAHAERNRADNGL